MLRGLANCTCLLLIFCTIDSGLCVLTCPPLQLKKNVVLECKSPLNDQGTPACSTPSPIGTIATYQCEEFYKPITRNYSPTASMLCLESGRWSKRFTFEGFFCEIDQVEGLETSTPEPNSIETQEKRLNESAYIRTFLSQFEMDEYNTKILLGRFKQQYGFEADGAELNKIRLAYISWFTQKFEMNEINTNILLDRYKEIFGQSGQLVNSIQSAYVSWFIKFFEMNDINTKILLDRFHEIFGTSASGKNVSKIKKAFVSWLKQQNLGLDPIAHNE